MATGAVRGLALALVVAFAAATTAFAAEADVAEFYRGKNLRILVGYGPGTGYDVYARLLGRHIARHIPGQPGVVIQNMPGAASLTMANHLYNVAPRDGSAIGMPARWVFADALYGNGNARFDPRKFAFVGSMNREVGTCFTWHTSSIATIEDAMKRQVLVGATGATGTSFQFPVLLNALIGTKFKPVLGYPDSAAVGIAMERGELEGYCSFTWGSIKSARPRRIEQKLIRILLQLTTVRHPELAQVPLVMDFAHEEAVRQAFALVFADQEIARPVVAPPDVPAERVAALRQAFDATMKDKEFIADAARSTIEIDPIDGKAAEGVLARIYATPRAIVDRVKAIYADRQTSK
jgi:tripartite-type tricarboxylate transporter receptor subunit TctC